VAFGFAFDHGSFAALDEHYHSRDCTVPSIPGTLDSVLAAAGPPILALDLRDVPPAVEAWFAEVHASRMVGGSYWPGVANEMWFRRDIREHFDVLLFVSETSASRRREGTSYREDCLREHRPSPQGLVNLDFGAGLDHWRILRQP